MHDEGWHDRSARMFRLKTKDGIIARFIGTRSYWPEQFRNMRGELKYNCAREFDYMHYTGGRAACMLFDMNRADITEFARIISPAAYAIETGDTSSADSDLKYDDTGVEPPQ